MDSNPQHNHFETRTETVQKIDPELKLWQFLLFCAVGFAAVVLTTYAFINLFEGDEYYNPELVTTFSGNGNARTDFFEVGEAWELRWEHSGRIEKLEWRTESGEGSMLIDMHRKPIREQGGVNWPRAGRYYVDVTAEGDWQLQVYQFKN